MKKLRPTLPLASALTLICPFAHHTAGGLSLATSRGLTRTLCRVPKIPSQGAWRQNAREWGPPIPIADTPCNPAAIRTARGATGYSGRENGQCPQSPR